MLVTCKNCGHKFNRPAYRIQPLSNIFCSRSCATAYNNKQKPKRKPIERICSRCGKTFVRERGTRTILCSSCNVDYKAMTIKQYQESIAVKGKHPSWKNSHIRGFCRSWNKSLQKLPCQVCGYKIHVELAHIKAITEFSPETTLGEVNNPSNILVLCPNHHWEFDNKKLSLSSIPHR